MRNIVLLSVLALAACSEAQVSSIQTTNDKIISRAVSVAAAVCKVDSQDQPIVVALAAPVVTAVTTANAPAGAAVAGAVALDATVLHPTVTAACAVVGGVAVAAVPSK